VYTVDASVFLNAFDPREDGAAESLQFLSEVERRGLSLIEPALLLPELSGPARRAGNEEAVAIAFADSVASLTHVTLVPLEVGSAALARDIAAKHALRGADAVYAAVAQQHATMLVTMDKEQLSRLAGVVETRTPASALAELAPTSSPEEDT
jgi:predicted nucleic acid-binding protein